MAQPFDDREKICDGIKAKAALAEAPSVDDLRPQFVVVAEEEPLAYADLAPGPNQRFPFIRFDRKLFV